jgi:hypothetical protein
LALSLLTSDTLRVIASQPITLPANSPTRWLELRALKGNVTIQTTGKAARTARIGDRLQQAGETISTGSQSEAVLALDTAIGIVRLTEGTVLQVQQLQVSKTGGRISLLSVSQGLARLQIRSFNNPSSRLEIKTPAGVAGVRGTEFGVGVNPSGKTTVATKQGQVATSAQDETVLVGAGFYSLVIPGQPPTIPQSIREDVQLSVQQLQVLPASSTTEKQVRMIGRVEPANAVSLNGAAIDINPEGQFDVTAPLPSDRKLQVVVRSPLGQERSYSIEALVNP